MPGTSDLFPPFTFDWWWWAALPVFIALLVAWILLSKRAARIRGWSRIPESSGPIAPWRPPIDPRLQALQRVQLVEDALGAGQITVRDAHLELSTILRDFAWHRTGVDARKMTLAELRTSDLGRIADLIEDFYPIVFSPDPSRKVDDALTNVRSVVRSWN